MPGIVTGMHRPLALLERIARDLAIALITGVGIGLTLTYVGAGEALNLVPSSPEQDWQAYLGAAERLRAGAPLYPQGADPGAAVVGLAALVRFARGPAGWFAASFAVVMVMPRRLHYDITFLLASGRELLERELPSTRKA